MPEKAKSDHIASRAHGLLGSLKDALAAASREDMPASLKALAGPARAVQKAASAPDGEVVVPPLPVVMADGALGKRHVDVMEGKMASGASSKSDGQANQGQANVPSAEEAARAVRGSLAMKPNERSAEDSEPPTTRVVRKPPSDAGKRGRDGGASAKGGSGDGALEEATAPPRTQLVRGRQKLARTNFAQDPVVGWLVVVGGPGLGAFRPVFEGNNTIGRSSSNRIAVDFGDDAISSEEQAYIRYDSTDRSFLFVPNLAKTNVVSVNDKRPTAAVELAHMDVITMGRTQLVFVPFCGSDFDWAELAEVKD